MTTKWINIHIDGVQINQSYQSKSLGLIVDGRKSREVDLFHLQECETERNLLARKSMIDISDFSCASRAIVAKAENDSQQIKRLRVLFEYCSQINLFVYSAVCREHYWQTAKAVPLSNASWKDKTVFKPIGNYFIDLQML